MKIINTQNGDKTLFVPSMDETYHSRNGAISESDHVFIKEGLYRTSGPIHILEIGFGTGLNALLTAIESEKEQRIITYHTLEPYPVPDELIEQLDYGELTQNVDLFRQLHHAKWETEELISSTFIFLKSTQKIEDISLKETFYNLVFFDAFAPKKQPEMWTIDVFEKLIRSLKKGGVLVTYSAAGQLKRDLKTVGFTLLHPPGANGKREMTVAIKA